MPLGFRAACRLAKLIPSGWSLQQPTMTNVVFFLTKNTVCWTYIRTKLYDHDAICWLEFSKISIMLFASKYICSHFDWMYLTSTGRVMLHLLHPYVTSTPFFYHELLQMAREIRVNTISHLCHLWVPLCKLTKNHGKWRWIGSKFGCH